MAYETEKLEFKVTATNDIYKEVVAFANTDGGTLVIGVTDDGAISPLMDIDDVYLRITNGIRDNILPDITMLIKYSLEDNRTIQINIAEGTRKPYYLKAKGLKTSGVFVRQGTSSAPASDDHIRQMIKDTDNDVFEEFPALNQNLTFNQCREAFLGRGIEFEESKFPALGIFDANRQAFTNLGLLLSDQCQNTIKVAVFEDVKNTIFKGRKEFTGSLLKQIDDAFDYLQLNNNTESEITGLVREDFPDYPAEALREALLNAIIHRNYEYSGSIIINVNREFMEFISIGGLLPGLTTDEMLNGVSILRNEKLSKIFLRLRIIEAYGTGIRRIFALYERNQERPQINVTQNSFKFTLPNLNFQRKRLDTASELSNISPQAEVIITYLQQHGEATDEEIQELLSVKKTRAFVITKQLVEKGLIKIVGRGASRRITL